MKIHFTKWEDSSPWYTCIELLDEWISPYMGPLEEKKEDVSPLFLVGFCWNFHWFIQIRLSKKKNQECQNALLASCEKK